jgi:gliding motility-associated protein GldM
MAGGKLSPRQKMINMMYLVLLALLAMNITTEVLDAFDILRVELANSAAAANSANDNFAESMKDEIRDEIDNEGKKDNEGLLNDTIPMIRDKTLGTIAVIDSHITEMERIGEKDSITGELTKKDQLEDNHVYWMGKGDQEIANQVEDFGPRGGGQAFRLRDEIDEYSRWMVNMYNAQLKGDDAEEKKLKLDDYLLKDRIAYNEKGEPNPQYNETWESYNFKGPVGANIAYLEALKAKVYSREKELLNLLNERLGVATFKVDKVVPINAPTATIVPAGLQFQSKLYVAMSSSQIKPRFSGAGVKPDEGGNSATLTVTANGARIPKGKKEGKQGYSATIQVPKATGGFETLNVQGEFTVRKPEVVITSASVQNLYRNCGNAVNIDVPALGELYNPKINLAGGGSARQSEKDRKTWLLVPTGRKAVVQVSSLTNGQLVKIDDVQYNVIEPPKPSIVMEANGRAYDGTTPLPATSRIKIYIKADPEFRAALPRDARYSVNQVEVLAQLSLGPPTRVNTVRGSNDMESGVQVSLGTRVRQARRGTKVYVRVDKISRINYKGDKIEDKRLSEMERTLSFVTR